MFPILTAGLIILALMAFTYTMVHRLLLLKVAQGSDNRMDRFGERIVSTLKYAIGQGRFLNKKRDLRSGIMHALIFWGFCVISIRTLTLFGIGFSEDFVFPLMGGILGTIYNATLNVFLVLVSIAVGYMLYRRLVSKPRRLTMSTEGTVILCIILSLCLTDFLFDAAHTAATGQGISGAFIGHALSHLFLPFSATTNLLIAGLSLFVHLFLILAFMNFLPYGKHFHIITGIPNVFFRNLKPYGALRPINLEDETATTFGVDHIEQFTPKNYLDWFTCTECGRCQDMCPAFNSDKPLSPKELTINLRNFLYAKQGKLIQGLHNDQLPRDEMGFIADEKPLLGETIAHETLWACTTCRACEEACPVFIEYVQEIVDMRRNLVLVKGEFPQELQATFVNLERNYNPWGIGSTDRGNWAKDMGVKTMEEDASVDYLYFVGCAGNFDDRNKKVTFALAKLLKQAGISFAILGKEEKCTGDPARRVGNEYLAQMLMKENIATFDKYKVKKVITSCPHCFNTIANEYGQFGGNYEVIHHTQFLMELIEKGLIKPTKEMNKKIVYHDSCYLGRYNNIYDAPREILKAIPGLELTEAELNKQQGRCCGAGGGRMWMEEKLGKRVNQMRLGDLKETGAQTAATACPFCKIMVGDAIKETKAENIDTHDIVELLAESVGVS